MQILKQKLSESDPSLASQKAETAAAEMGFTSAPGTPERRANRPNQVTVSDSPTGTPARPHTASSASYSPTLAKLCDDLVSFDLANTNSSQLRQCTLHLNASELPEITGWTTVQSDQSDVSSDSSTRGRRKLVRQIFEAESNLTFADFRNRESPEASEALPN